MPIAADPGPGPTVTTYPAVQVNKVQNGYIIHRGHDYGHNQPFNPTTTYIATDEEHLHTVLVSIFSFKFPDG